MRTRMIRARCSLLPPMYLLRYLLFPYLLLRKGSRSLAVAGFALAMASACLVTSTLAFASSLESDSTIAAARLAEANQDYSGALDYYREFLQANPDSTFASQIMTRVSVLQEASRNAGKGADSGSDEALALYLEALNLREARDVDGAREKLQTLLADYPGGYLSDDAVYLQGYIAMMDAYQYDEAHALFRRLKNDYPDSSYIDTALYSEAISLEQLGNTEGATRVFEELRERHTEFSLSIMGVRWPKSTYLSRYWYDRANNRLKLLQERSENAARLVSRSSTGKTEYAEYDAVLDVAAAGRQMRLLLRRSSVMNDTNFDTEGELTLALSNVKYYSGTVEHDPHSWARVMIRGEEIQGIVETAGERIDLEPASMAGSIDYYKPDDGKPQDIEALRLQDYVMHPPPDPDARLNLMLQGIGDSQGAGQADEPMLGAAVSAGVNRLVRMDVYVDSQYNNYYGGDGLLQAMSALNVADGIYRQNFGLALEIGNATVFTDRNSDPMNLGAVTLESTLRKFRDLRLSSSTSSPDIALTYLFSGNDNVDEAIGLAWIGAICRNDGFDVGVTTPSSYADLLVTHELGHSLGALHDTDTNCTNERNLLMWPRISRTTNQAFSGCSVNSVSAGVAKSCVLNTIDLSLNMQPLGDSGFAAVVTNNDSSSTAHNASLVLQTAAVDLNRLPAGCVESAAGELLCELNKLPPGGSTQIEFSLAAAVAADSLLARIDAGGSEYDVVTENNQAQLSLEGSVGAGSQIAANTSIQSDAASAASGSSDSDASGNSGGGGGSADWWLLVSAMLYGFVIRALTRR